MTAAAVETTVRWEPLATLGEPVDIAAEMMRLTLRIVGETLLSTELSDDADAVGGALAVVQEDTNDRVKSVINFPLGIPTPRNKRFLRARKILDDVVMRAIRERRPENAGALPLPLPKGGVTPSKDDLLHMLMSARDEETGDAMSDVQLRDEVMTIFLAGHETTSNALSWCWYCLSKNPACERELARVVFLSPYVTQRHPAFWENPEGFAPERFRPENEAARPLFPLRWWPPKPLITLRPGGGMPMTIHARQVGQA